MFNVLINKYNFAQNINYIYWLKIEFLIHIGLCLFLDKCINIHACVFKMKYAHMCIIIFDICKAKQKKIIVKRERDRLNVFFIVLIYCAWCVIFIKEFIIIIESVFHASRNNKNKSNHFSIYQKTKPLFLILLKLKL